MVICRLICDSILGIPAFCHTLDPLPKRRGFYPHRDRDLLECWVLDTNSVDLDRKPRQCGQKDGVAPLLLVYRPSAFCLSLLSLLATSRVSPLVLRKQFFRSGPLPPHSTVLHWVAMPDPCVASVMSPTGQRPDRLGIARVTWRSPGRADQFKPRFFASALTRFSTASRAKTAIGFSAAAATSRRSRCTSGERSSRTGLIVVSAVAGIGAWSFLLRAIERTPGSIETGSIISAPRAWCHRRGNASLRQLWF